MGLDLKLLIVDGELTHRPYSHTMLTLDRTGIAQLVRGIDEKHGAEFENGGLYCFLATPKGDKDGAGEHYGVATETPYGDPICWVHAKRLKSLARRKEVTTSRFNKAAWAYVCELPDDTRIGLYFH